MPVDLECRCSWTRVNSTRAVISPGAEGTGGNRSLSRMAGIPAQSEGPSVERKRKDVYSSAWMSTALPQLWMPGSSGLSIRSIPTGAISSNPRVEKQPLGRRVGMLSRSLPGAGIQVLFCFLAIDPLPLGGLVRLPPSAEERARACSHFCRGDPNGANCLAPLVLQLGAGSRCHLSWPTFGPHHGM